MQKLFNQLIDSLIALLLGIMIKFSKDESTTAKQGWFWHRIWEEQSKDNATRKMEA